MPVCSLQSAGFGELSTELSPDTGEDGRRRAHFSHTEEDIEACPEK